MGLNRTAEFQDAVLRHAKNAGSNEAQLLQLRKAQVLRSLAASGDFSRAAADVARNLTALFEFVKTNRHEYVQPGRLTDAERDQIEQQVALSVRTCSANIERLERNVQLSRPQGLNETTCAHRLGVVLSLSERLQHASALFDRCRSMRSKQAAQQRQLQQALNKPAGWRGMVRYTVQGRRRVPTVRHRIMTLSMVRTNQVTRVEKTMLEVSALHQMFATQIIHQSQQIEEVYMQAVRATNNLQAGNQNLKKAIRLNTSARLYVLLLLLLASGGLLFLDWYSS